VVVGTTGLAPILKALENTDVPMPDHKALDSLLYSTEKLRKRGDEDAAEAE